MKRELSMVLLHGAGLGGYIWDEVLQSIKNPALRIEFPGRSGSEKDNSNVSIQEYVDLATAQIESWDVDRFVIIAHSIGGCLGLIMNDRFRKRAKGFIGIGSIIPKKNRSFASSFPFPQNRLLPLILHFLGTRPPDNSIRNELCNDLSPDKSDEIVQRFFPESKRLYTSRISYDSLPADSLYIKLTHDQAISSNMQNKMVSNLGTTKIAELESGHLPMYSKPKQLASIIIEYLAERSQIPS